MVNPEQLPSLEMRGGVESRQGGRQRTDGWKERLKKGRKEEKKCLECRDEYLKKRKTFFLLKTFCCMVVCEKRFERFKKQNAGLCEKNIDRKSVV